MRTILTTVGTSLLANGKRTLKLDDPDDHALARYLRDTAPEKASAETNSLFRLLHKGDRIILLHSDTPDGERCATLLARYYDKTGYHTESHRIHKLDYRESGFAIQGLRHLVSTLCGLIRQERRAERDIAINATGGFKAEIAYATLVGLLFDAPVFYIHEAFGDIIEMPPTPIGWDLSLVEQHEEFFDWISSELRRTEEVTNWKYPLPNAVHLLLHEEDGYVMLSPMGEAIYGAFQQRLDEAAGDTVVFSQRAREAYKGMDPNVAGLFKPLFARLRIREIRRGSSEAVDNAGCFVYPRGNRDGRIFYTEERDGSLHVLELARHSDGSYEAVYKRGITASDYRDFGPLT